MNLLKQEQSIKLDMMFDKWLDKAKGMRPGFLEFFDKNTLVRNCNELNYLLDAKSERWY